VPAARTFTWDQFLDPGRDPYRLDGALYATSAIERESEHDHLDGHSDRDFNQPVKFSTMTFGAAISSGGLSAASYTGVLDTTNTI